MVDDKFVLVVFKLNILFVFKSSILAKFDQRFVEVELVRVELVEVRLVNTDVRADSRFV